jgi:hypothetical protein
MDNVENEKRMAKVEADLTNIKELLLEIKQDIKSQPYVPRAEISLMFNAVNDRIDTLEESHKQSKTLMIAWVGIGISVVSMILAFFHK